MMNFDKNNLHLGHKCFVF